MGLKENQALAEEYPILQFFQYAHLPEDLRKVSAPFNTLAWKIAREVPHDIEKIVALRKLLESKDAAVRAKVSWNNVQKFVDVPETNEAGDVEVTPKTPPAAHPFVEGYPKPSS